MKVIIVGGVAGGATAAARIRRLNEHAEITVFERSGYISYANCGLPYYIGDVITDPEELTLQTPESFFKRFHINMKIHHEVISIHPERKTVSVKNLENGEIFEEKYYPIKKEMILSKLKMMGYTNISVYCFPSYFKMPEFELVDWYCIMAKKND